MPLPPDALPEPPDALPEPPDAETGGTPDELVDPPPRLPGLALHSHTPTLSPVASQVAVPGLPSAHVQATCAPAEHGLTIPSGPPRSLQLRSRVASVARFVQRTIACFISLLARRYGLARHMAIVRRVADGRRDGWADGKSSPRTIQSGEFV